MNSKTTIITTVHDRLEFLEESLASTVGKAPVIVVSDSADASKIVSRVNPDARYIHIEPCLLGRSRNEAAKLVETPYFIIVDDDDHLINLPSESFLDNDPRVGVVHGNYVKFGYENARMCPYSGNITYEMLLHTNLLFQSSLIRKTAWESVNGWWEECALAEDWNFWARIAKMGWTFKYDNQDIIHYRLHQTSGWLNSMKDPQKHRDGINALLNHARNWNPQNV